MQDLKEHEQFEIEVLEKLNSRRLLADLIFIGGTMLRLCYGLNRYSVDLGFWLLNKIDEKRFFNSLKKLFIDEDYALKDAAIKHHTILFEIKSDKYPQSLKIEIRKGDRRAETETAIAYSPNSNAQVFLNTLTLKEMLKAKVKAFLSRKEIRDVFDLEFLVKRGVGLDLKKEELTQLLAGIERLGKNDYRHKLIPLLLASERKYYIDKNFVILKAAIQDALANV